MRHAGNVTVPGGGVHPNNNNNDTKMLFLSLIDNQDGSGVDENAQSILEEHCNRIGWDISRGKFKAIWSQL